jgi:hypothetical protein
MNVDDMCIQVGGSQEVECEKCGGIYQPTKEFHMCPKPAATSTGGAGNQDYQKVHDPESTRYEAIEAAANFVSGKSFNLDNISNQQWFTLMADFHLSQIESLKAERDELVKMLKSVKHIRTNDWMIRHEEHGDLETQEIVESGFYGYRDEWEGGRVGPFKSIMETVQALQDDK